MILFLCDPRRADFHAILSVLPAHVFPCCFRSRENTLQMGHSPSTTKATFTQTQKNTISDGHTDGHKSTNNMTRKKKRQSWINVTAQGGWIHDYHPVSLPYLMLLSGDTKSTLYFRQPFAAVSFTAHAFTNAHLIMLLVKTKCYAHLFCGKVGFFLLQ